MKRRSFFAVPLVIIGAAGCSVQRGSSDSLTSIVNTTIRASEGVSDSAVFVDYGKNPIFNSRHANLSGTITYPDNLHDRLNILLPVALRNASVALKEGGIEKGDVSIQAVSGNVKMSIQKAYGVKDDAVVTLKDILSSSKGKR